MPADSGDKRPARQQGAVAAHPAPRLNDPLPCPRCQSTSTKFCYYNNYNLAQPRYFCKGCRRYWTHGGTLRNVPVGGGTRKNTAKRSRSSSSSSTSSASSPPVAVSSSSAMTHEAESVPVPANLVPVIPGQGVKPSEMGLGEVNLNESVGDVAGGRFTSLLNNQGQGQGYLTLGGYGFGTGTGTGAGFDGVWGYTGNGYFGGFGGVGGAAGAGGSSGGCNTWQMTNDIDAGGLGDGDCFGWPGLAISAPGKGLK